MRALAIVAFAWMLGCSAAEGGAQEDAETQSASGQQGGGGGAGSEMAGSSSSGAGASSSSGGSTGGSSAGAGGAPMPFHLEDTLQGSTQGDAIGGTLGPDGWTVTARTDRLWWALPRLVQGSVEFTLTNATLANLTVNDNEVLALYDAGFGIEEPINYNPEYRNNNFKAMIRIYGTDEPERTGLQKTIWLMCPGGAPGYSEAECPCGNSFLEEPFGGDATWDGSPQVMRLEWGGGQTRLYRNGVEVHTIDWSGSGIEFGPNELHLSLGTSRASAVDSAGMPVGAVFSNVVIDGVTGPEAADCN